MASFERTTATACVCRPSHEQRSKSYARWVVAVLVLLTKTWSGGAMSMDSDRTTTLPMTSLAPSSNHDEDEITTSGTFLVCSVDGSIAILDARSGTYQGLLETHRPLVSASAPDHVVPGLDGRLYQYVYTHDQTEQDQDPELQVLPMTIRDILLHPVRTCQTKIASTTADTQQQPQQETCGIVTGTKLTHLYAWNPSTRQLEWTQQPPPQQQEYANDDTDKEQCQAVLWLQREDFVVRHIAASTGKEVWNVTLGRFSALDFDAGGDDVTDFEKSRSAGYLPAEREPTQDAGDDTHFTRSESTPSWLPSIAFGKDGKTLTAIGPQGTLLWRRQWHAVVASVYGVRGDSWVPLEVVEEPEAELVESGHMNYYKTTLAEESGLLIAGDSTLPLAGSGQEKQMYMDILWNELQELAGRTHSQSDVLVYPDSDVLGWYGARESLGHRQQEQDCVRDASGFCLVGSPRHGHPQLLLGSGIDPPFPSPETHGLFVSWNMVAGILLFLVTAAVAMRVLYVHKKRHWLKHRTTLLPTAGTRVLASSWHERHSLDPQPLLHMTQPNTGTGITTRSMSLPLLDDGIPLLDDGKQTRLGATHRDITALNREKAARAGTNTTSSPSSSGAPEPARIQGVGHIDGIPLVRYSRYRSEFRELSPLGRGGFGSVFRCCNQLDDREYAVKKIHIQSEIDVDGNVTKEFSQRLQRVLREVKILALLDHINIVRYYTAWLELEDGDVDQSSPDMGVTGHTGHDDSKMSRCYSSELFAGASTTGTGRRPPSSPQRERNPLGWKNSPGDFDVSLRRDYALSEEDVDCGFTFEAGENEIRSIDEPSARWSLSRLPVVVDGRTSSDGSSQANSSEPDGSEDSGVSLSLQDERSRDMSGRPSEEGSHVYQSPSVGPSPTRVRHTLYIQMQLCSQKTLGDFLATPDARKGTSPESRDSSVDIPRALGLFQQVTQAVMHVHEQGLIHRDLKPINCFMDDGGVVKVGDFGLSRESSTGTMDEEEYQVDLDHTNSVGVDENTVGVGTRSYASPEQMSGSDYDSSTDVYSLGIMLFELCYPMYTSMERQIVFSRLRNFDFPDDWMSGVARSFPTVHRLVLEMLSPQPGGRPAAKVVAHQIESLLDEFTILSLDRRGHATESSIWVRVEAEADHGVLPRTMSIIQTAAPQIRILQYGLRGHEQTEGRTAIMEFALALPSGDDESPLREVFTHLRATQDIHVVRQVSGAASAYK